jgi:hypothetical protein
MALRSFSNSRFAFGRLESVPFATGPLWIGRTVQYCCSTMVLISQMRYSQSSLRSSVCRAKDGRIRPILSALCSFVIPLNAWIWSTSSATFLSCAASSCFAQTLARRASTWLEVFLEPFSFDFDTNVLSHSCSCCICRKQAFRRRSRQFRCRPRQYLHYSSFFVAVAWREITAIRSQARSSGDWCFRKDRLQ